MMKMTNEQTTGGDGERSRQTEMASKDDDDLHQFKVTAKS